jgi:uncharacterized protein (DUF2384 family)
MSFPVQKSNRVGLMWFFKIMTCWSQPIESQMKLLGIEDSAAFNKLHNKQSTDISDETLIRISYIMNIYQNLHTIFATNESADSWVNRANTQFDNLSASEYMQLEGVEGLKNVSEYLFAECG